MCVVNKFSTENVLYFNDQPLTCVPNTSPEPSCLGQS